MGFYVVFLNAVFLGGSCKPTTWRDDYAVPFFSQCGISFYNPVSVTKALIFCFNFFTCNVCSLRKLFFRHC